MGNDIAGSKVTPTLEVLYSPQTGKVIQIESQTNSDLYLACVITHAQARKNVSDEVTLSDSVLMPVLSDEAGLENKTETTSVSPCKNSAELERSGSSKLPVADSLFPLPATRECLSEEQRADPTLHICFSGVVSARQNK